MQTKGGKTRYARSGECSGRCRYGTGQLLPFRTGPAYERACRFARSLFRDYRPISNISTSVAVSKLTDAPQAAHRP